MMLSTFALPGDIWPFHTPHFVVPPLSFDSWTLFFHLLTWAENKTLSFVTQSRFQQIEKICAAFRTRTILSCYLDHPSNFMSDVLVFDSSVLLWFKHVKNPSYHGDFLLKTEPTYSANRQQDAPLAAAKALWPTTSASAIPVTSKHQPSGIVIW